MANEAKVKVGVEGAGDAAAAAEKVLGAFTKAGAKAKEAFGQIAMAMHGPVAKMGELEAATNRLTSGIMSGFASAAGSVANFVTAGARFDMTSSTEKYRAFTNTVSRDSVFLGGSVDGLKQRFADVGRALNLPDEVVAQFAHSLASATHDTADSRTALIALGHEATATGKSLAEMMSFGATLHNGLGVGMAQIPMALDSIRAKAEAAGMGADALQERLSGLAGVVPNLNASPETMGKLASFAATAKVKGASEMQTRQAQAEVLRYVTDDPQGGLRRSLGMSYKTYQDKVRNDPASLIAATRKYMEGKYHGSAETVLGTGNMSPLAAAMMMHYDDAAVRKSEGTLMPQLSARARGEKLRSSDAWKGEAAQLSLERKQREAAGKVGNNAQQSYTEWAEQNPFLAGAGEFIGNHGYNTVSTAITGAALTGKLPALWKGARTLGGAAAQGAKGALSAGALAATAGVSAFLYSPSLNTGEGADIEEDRRMQAEYEASHPASGSRVAYGPERAAPNFAAPASFDNKPVVVQVQIVDNTGSPKGAFTTYQAGQSRQ